MGRYRRVEVKTWSDEKFLRLSPMPPSGQALWLFLMTGPHTGPIPGLFRAGRAGMAEELGWDLEAFDKAFREVFREGMAKGDFKARLVWLPNALKHNKPESPNVVRSWKSEIELLPECALKAEAICHIRSYMESLGPAYIKAFEDVDAGPKPLAKALPKALPKASPKAMPNQEQEQEQEQEKEKPLAWNRGDDPGSKPSTRIKPNSAGWEGISEQDRDTWSRAYPAVDIDLELSKAFSWFMANQNKTKRNWHRFLTNWLARCQERGGSCKTGQRKANPPPVTQEYQPCPYRDISQDIDPEEARAYEEKYNTWS